jgi:hypothetical protein
MKNNKRGGAWSCTLPRVFCLPVKGGREVREYCGGVGVGLRIKDGRRFVPTAGRIKLARSVPPHGACQRRPRGGVTNKDLFFKEIIIN